MSKRPPPAGKAGIMRIMRELTHTKRTWEVFRDFCEISALTLANSVTYGAEHARREARYLEIVSQYEPEQMQLMCQAFACLVDALETEPCDVLGSVFMELDLGSHWHGQFFTPYALARMMGELTVGADDPQTLLQERGYLTVQEPAAGAGAMVIGFCEALRARQINYQQCVHVTAVDVDPLCVHMAYVQFALLHIPAVVIHGNTLSAECWAHWYTPAHVIDLWSYRLKRQKVSRGTSDVSMHTDTHVAHSLSMNADTSDDTSTDADTRAESVLADESVPMSVTEDSAPPNESALQLGLF